MDNSQCFSIILPAHYENTQIMSRYHADSGILSAQIVIEEQLNSLHKIIISSYHVNGIDILPAQNNLHVYNCE